MDLDNLAESPFLKALDALYERGGDDQYAGLKFDPRGCREYQAILDMVRTALAPKPCGLAPMDKGPWLVHNDGECVTSCDFTHDVWLKLSGDFCPESRRMYAKWLASVLNAARPEVP